MKTQSQMKTRLIRDPITHETLGVLLSTNPDLWDEWTEPPPPQQGHEHEPTWATLFGLDED